MKGVREYKTDLLKISKGRSALNTLSDAVKDVNFSYTPDFIQTIATKADIDLNNIPSEQNYITDLKETTLGTGTNFVKNKLEKTTSENSLFSDTKGGLGNFNDLQKILSTVGIMGLLMLLMKFFKLDLSQIETLNDISQIGSGFEKLIPGINVGDLDGVGIPTNIPNLNLPKIPKTDIPIVNNLATAIENNVMSSALSLTGFGLTPNIPFSNPIPKKIDLEQYKPIEYDVPDPFDYKKNVKVQLSENPLSESKIRGNLEGETTTLASGSIRIPMEFSFQYANNTVAGRVKGFSMYGGFIKNDNITLGVVNNTVTGSVSLQFILYRPNQSTIINTTVPVTVSGSLNTTDKLMTIDVTYTDSSNRTLTGTFTGNYTEE